MRLPRHVDPRKLALQDARFSGPVATSDMVRLADAVVAKDENAEVNLGFSLDQSRHVVVEGEFSLKVSLECQRCMQPVEKRLQGEILLGVVWAEERVEVLPKRYDPWLIEGDSADVYEMLEDELLLTLPIVAYHEEDQCPRKGTYSTGEVEESGRSPFEVLAKLKK